MTNERLHANLDLATVLLQTAGFAQAGETPGLDVLEALHHATVGCDAGAHDEYQECLAHVAAAIGISVVELASWNDAEGRTIDDVYVAFAKAKLADAGAI